MLEGNSAAEKVVQRIEGDRDFVIELAQDLVRIPSVNPKFQVGEGINREADVQRLVASHLGAVGMTTDSYDVFPERPNVYGYRGGTAENSLSSKVTSTSCPRVTPLHGRSTRSQQRWAMGRSMVAVPTI